MGQEQMQMSLFINNFKIKKIIKGLSFIIIVYFILFFTLYWLMDWSIRDVKYRQISTQANNLKAKGANADVIFIGPSTTCVELLSPLLFHEKGISSYNYCVDGTDTWAILPEIFESVEKTFKPKIYVIDIGQMRNENIDIIKYFNSNKINAMNIRAFNDLDNIQQRINSFNTLTNKNVNLSIFKPVDMVELYKGFSKNWMNLITKRNPNCYFGSLTETITKGCEIQEYYKTSQPQKVNNLKINMDDIADDQRYEFLQNELSLQKKKGIKIIFRIPPLGETYDEKQQKNMNSLKISLRKHGEMVVDENERIKEIGINYENNFYNSGHLNYFGAEKLTTWWGEKLNEKFELLDNRKNKVYDVYEKSYQSLILNMK
jgi:hypothetical protein